VVPSLLSLDKETEGNDADDCQGEEGGPRTDAATHVRSQPKGRRASSLLPMLPLLPWIAIRCAAQALGVSCFEGKQETPSVSFRLCVYEFRCGKRGAFPQSWLAEGRRELE